MTDAQAIMNAPDAELDPETMEAKRQQYTKRLKALQTIRDLARPQGGEIHLRLPQICVVGDQTSGKSSLLGCLTGIDFPVKSRICTKAPIVVECNRDPELVQDTYYVRDPYTGNYERCSYLNLARRITDAQNRILGEDEEEEDEDADEEDAEFQADRAKTKVTSEEIRVQVVGPHQMDIIVVDLPGIISAGEGGKEETRALIRNYCQHDETLILLVSEANMDDERISALDIAKEVDPEEKRTMRVLTMFDNFSTPAAKKNASDFVRSAHEAYMYFGNKEAAKQEHMAKRRKIDESDNGMQLATSDSIKPDDKSGNLVQGRVVGGGMMLDLTPHAVVCRVRMAVTKKNKEVNPNYAAPKEGEEGEENEEEEVEQDEEDRKMTKAEQEEMCMRYDPEREGAILVKECGIPPEKAGIEALKKRLPQIFAHLIQVNLPVMEAMATRKLMQAKQRLKKVGELPIPSNLMIMECQNVLKKRLSDVEEEVSVIFKEFSNKVHTTGLRIEQGWTDAKFTPNVFKAPLFQGEVAFTNCFKEIVSWWEPLLHQYVQELERMIAESLHCLTEEANGVSHHLIAYMMNTLWLPYCRQIFQVFRNCCKKTLEREIYFGTDNHYLESKYCADMLVPEEIIKEFCDKLCHEDLFNKVLVISKTGNAQELCYFEKSKDVKPIEFVRETMKKKLLTVRAEWAKEFGAKSLAEQQKRRLFAAVKAAWAVEKKTFVDIVLKETRDEILEKRKEWIERDLLLAPEIQLHAREDDAIIAERERLRSEIDRMQRCILELREII